LRRYEVQLSYSDNYVGIISQSTPSSGITPISLIPTPNAANYMTATVTADTTNSNYTGSIGFGSSTTVKSNTKISFDTY